MDTGSGQGKTAKTGKVKAVCTSSRKGVSKEPVAEVNLVVGVGVEGDAHAGTTKRQVSLLCGNSIEKIRALGAEVGPGDFAENLTVEGCTWRDFPLGARIQLARGPLLQVTQIGKECHTGCAIAEQVGTCVMPKEGIFARVLKGGPVRPGDELEVLANEA